MTEPMNRRVALRSLFVAAPAIVAAPTLMRVSAAALLVPPTTRWVVDLPARRLMRAEPFDMTGWRIRMDRLKRMAEALAEHSLADNP